MRNRPPRRPGPRRRPQGKGRSPAVVREAAVAVAPSLPSAPVELPPALTVKEFSERLGLSASVVIRELLQNGIIASVNQTIDFETAAIVAEDLGIEVHEMSLDLDHEADLAPARPEDLAPRPAVVTVMGHVDHGKTSLLDAIRKTRVTAGEVGGITQHIGAYQVDVHGQRVTFLDTPGHEAFTSMRARGAKVTDIAILVVAADDGVMPTTKEAADHARAAGVPVIVALNKMDREDANPDRVKQQLVEIGLVVEDFGGDVVLVPVSARNGEGIETLLEMVLVVAEIGAYQANIRVPANGTVIEAKLDKARGPVATVLVENGMLNVGDVVVVGGLAGRIRALFNDRGKRVRLAEPAMPVEVMGLDGVPHAGDRLQVVSDEKTARAMAQAQKRGADVQTGASLRELGVEAILEGIRTGALKDLNLIIKADVRGSLEAISASIQSLAEKEAVQREIRTKVVHADTGNVTESDVMLAAASKGIVIAFNVRAEPGARRVADNQGVEIRSYQIIYQMIDDIERLLGGMLEPSYREVIAGEAEVRQVFKIGRTHAAAGLYVTSGAIPRNAMIRIRRGKELLYEGRLDSLRRFKDDVREVQNGYECGINISSFADYQEGDVVQAYTREVVGA